MRPHVWHTLICIHFLFQPGPCLGKDNELAKGKVLFPVVTTFDLKLNPGCQDIAFSPNGRLVAAAFPFGVSVYDIRKGEACCHVSSLPKRHSKRVVFSSGNDTLVTSGIPSSSYCYISVTKHQVVKWVKIDRPLLSLAFSPNGKELALGWLTGDPLKVVNVSSGRARSLPGLERRIKLICYSPDGKLIGLVQEYGDFVSLRDARSGKEVCRVCFASFGNGVFLSYS
jgi:WD40 repeat protein